MSGREIFLFDMLAEKNLLIILNILLLLVFQRCLHLHEDIFKMTEFSNPHLRMNCVVDDSVTVFQIKFLKFGITIKLRTLGVD